MHVGIYRFLQQHPFHPCLASLVSFLLFHSLFQSFSIPLSHAETDTPPSPSSYSRGVSKCVCECVSHTAGGGSVNRWQDLFCSSLTPVSVSSVTRVQRWKWAGVTQHARGDVTAHLSPSVSKSGAQLAACGAGWVTIIIYSRSLHTKLICKAVMSRHFAFLFELQHRRRGVGMVEGVQRVLLVCLKSLYRLWNEKKQKP